MARTEAQHKLQANIGTLCFGFRFRNKVLELRWQWNEGIFNDAVC